MGIAFTIQHLAACRTPEPAPRISKLRGMAMVGSVEQIILPSTLVLFAGISGLPSVVTIITMLRVVADCRRHPNGTPLAFVEAPDRMYTMILRWTKPNTSELIRDGRSMVIV